MNKNRPSISVAMTVYNGERYLKEQIDSILKQLSKTDELVISLDPSKDKSEEILESYARKDNRIKVLKGPGKGVIKNFEHALLSCKNEIIFLCDQDDIWHDDKVRTIVKGFCDPDVILQVHNARIIDADGVPKNGKETFFDVRKSGEGLLKNIYKNSFIGCCMAFRKKLLEDCLPFPRRIPMHDQWIGLVAQFNGKVVFLKKVLIDYRRHEGNVSANTHSKWIIMLKWRIEIVSNIFIYRCIKKWFRGWKR